MAKTTVYEEFTMLYEGSNVMIDTLDRFFDSKCYCSCLPLVTQLLREIHTIANDLMDGLGDARRGLDYGDLYDIAIYDHYILDTIIRFLEIIARHNPCDDYSKNCDITSILRRIYVLACEVNCDFAYIANKTENMDDDDNGNGSSCCTCIPDTPLNQPIVTPEKSLQVADDELQDSLRDALYHLEQIRKLTDLMFKEYQTQPCSNSDALYDDIIENIEEAIKQLQKARELSGLDDYECYYCDNYISIQTAIGVLRAMKYTIEIFRDSPIDYCYSLDVEAMYSMQIYGPLFARLIRTLKSTAY